MLNITRILLVDDHPLVRTGLRRLLGDFPELEVSGEAENGEDAFRLCRELQPDLVLMDLKMPGIGGLEATRKISTHFPAIKIIALSAMEDELYASRLLQAGASGYVVKGAPFEEMVKAIRKVMAGQRYLSPLVAEQMALRQFDSGEASPFERLSERELQIALMVVNCHKVADISEQLNLSPKTVNSYRYRLFEKLGIESDVELTHLAIKYRMIESVA